MFRNSQILLPTDFSLNSDYAQKYAVAFAKRYNGKIHVVHIVDTGASSGGAIQGYGLRDADLAELLDALEDHARVRVDRIVGDIQDAGVSVEGSIVRGAPAKEIIAQAEEKGCTLIVMATHGRRGFDRLVFGSVAERVLRQSPVPLLSIKHPEHEFLQQQNGDIEIKTVLFPTDFSPFAEKALPFAESLAREFKAGLLMVHAHEFPLTVPEFTPEASTAIASEMEAAARRLMDQWKAKVKDVKVETEMRIGSPYRAVCDVVKEKSVDIVVVPTHGRTGIAHVFLGSVAERIVRHAPCPVLTIRPS